MPGLSAYQNVIRDATSKDAYVAPSNFSKTKLTVSKKEISSSSHQKVVNTLSRAFAKYSSKFDLPASVVEQEAKAVFGSSRKISEQQLGTLWVRLNKLHQEREMASAGSTQGSSAPQSGSVQQTGDPKRSFSPNHVNSLAAGGILHACAEAPERLESAMGSLAEANGQWDSKIFYFHSGLAGFINSLVGIHDMAVLYPDMKAPFKNELELTNYILDSEVCGIRFGDWNTPAVVERLNEKGIGFERASQEMYTFLLGLDDNVQELSEA